MAKKRNGRLPSRITPPSQYTQGVEFNASQKGAVKHPYFSFRYIDTGSYCIKKCSIEQFRSISDKLRILSGLDWGTIDTSPRETNGYEMLPVSELKSASPPPPFSNETQVVVFRFGGKKGRIVGIKRDSMFYVLFIDHNFTLYDHG